MRKSGDAGHSWAGGDGGPCPICGQDMAEKAYEERLPTAHQEGLVFDVIPV